MTPDLVCPACGARLLASTVVEFGNAYVEGFECDDYMECGAEWDIHGRVTVQSKVAP